MKTIILGAGITGLAAGYKKDAVIYEATDDVGGMCKTVRNNGFQYELGGGHWLFGLTDTMRSFITKELEVTLYDYEKKTGVLYNHIFDGNIQDYATKDPKFNSGSMKEFLFRRFGKIMCNLFFFPFNASYTSGLYDEVIQENEHKSPMSVKPNYNDTFSYPEFGISEILDALKVHCNIKFNKKAISINTKQRYVLFSDGTTEKYDRIISTIPLKEMLHLVDMYSMNLPHTSTIVYNICGDKGERFPDHHWLYLPFSKSGMYRIGMYSNVQTSAKYINKCCIYAEVSKHGGEEMHDKYSLIQQVNVLNELKALGIIKSIDFYDHQVIDYAYTYVRKEGCVEPFLHKLEHYNIHSIGRYGKWKFQGMASCIEDGLTS